VGNSTIQGETAANRIQHGFVQMLLHGSRVLVTIESVTNDASLKSNLPRRLFFSRLLIAVKSFEGLSYANALSPTHAYKLRVCGDIRVSTLIARSGETYTLCMADTFLGDKSGRTGKAGGSGDAGESPL